MIPNAGGYRYEKRHGMEKDSGTVLWRDGCCRKGPILARFQRRRGFSADIGAVMLIAAFCKCPDASGIGPVFD